VEPENKSLDLMAVRYLVPPPAQNYADERGMTWLDYDMQLWLGGGCSQAAHKSASLVFPTPIKSTSLKIVSRLACSVQVPEGSGIARVALVDHAGRQQVVNIVAGRDTSEWAYDCAGVKQQIKHRRASVFSSFPANLNDEPCAGHSYVSSVSLREIGDVKTIAFDWL